MGAHGKSLIEGILLGSVATNVLRHGKAHVLIMRFKLEGIEEVVVVHVVDRGETQEEIDANVRESKKKLEDITAELGRAGLKMKVHVRVGSPPDEINSVAERENVSLIAMSTRGMGVFR
jgi:nucleotide-binding universal stress UspA family protein